MELHKILALKIPDIDFTKDVRLQDDGDGKGSYIAEWKLQDMPKPTKAQLNSWAIELDLQYRQQLAVENRIYPRIQDQLDMIYHDKLNNTTVWVDTITAIKQANPKPTE